MLPGDGLHFVCPLFRASFLELLSAGYDNASREAKTSGSSLDAPNPAWWRAIFCPRSVNDSVLVAARAAQLLVGDHAHQQSGEEVDYSRGNGD